MAGEVDLLLDTSLWRPAFIVAAAWSDMEARLGEPGGESPAAGFGCSVMPCCFRSSGCNRQDVLPSVALLRAGQVKRKEGRSRVQSAVPVGMYRERRWTL